MQERDVESEAPVVLVNSAFVKKLLPHADPIGKRFRLSPNVNPDAPWQQIIGVLADTRQNGYETGIKPEFYSPLSRVVSPIMGIIVRTTDKPGPHLRDIQSAVHDVDPELPVFYPRTMEEVETRRLGSRTFLTDLLTGFACVALVLAVGGVFAVSSYSVSQRTSELGIRMACGATQTNIVVMIARQCLIPAILGLAVGVLMAILLSRGLTSLLYGIQALDPASYLGATLLLIISVALACLLPALRAVYLKPWRALHYE